MRSAIAVAVVLVIAGAARADAPRPSFADDVARAAQPITVRAGALAGKGADTLRTAIDGATFVMLGEDHGIEQIPTFATALCDELAPHGFHRVAIEVGPSVAPALAAMAAAKDGAAQMKAFDARYPETVAFYDWREDFGFLAACARATAARKAPLEIWGVDQELMGATGYVIDQILATRPGADATAALGALAKEAADDRQAAADAGDFGKLFLVAAAQHELDDAAALLAKQGSAPAQALYASLLRSRTIYHGQMSGSPYASNVDRALLMKESFFGQLSAAAAKDKAMPKVLVKLGGWHLYRGLNPLHSAELGDLIAEAADAHQVGAVNVLVLGVTGTQLAVTAPGAQGPTALDLRAAGSPYAFLTAFFAAQAPKAWTLFDLRALRPRFDAYGPLDRELERLVFGYDFLVLIADPRPEHPL